MSRQPALSRMRYPSLPDAGSLRSPVSPLQAAQARSAQGLPLSPSDHYHLARAETQAPTSHTPAAEPPPGTLSFADLARAGFPRPLAVPSAPAPLPGGYLPSSVVMGVDPIRSGLFGIERRARAVVGSEESAPRAPVALKLKALKGVNGGGTMRYAGQRLTERHKKVVLYLTKALAGCAPGECREFDAKWFAVDECKWSDSSYSLDLLWALLVDLRGAVLVSAYDKAHEVAEPILGCLERDFYKTRRNPATGEAEGFGGYKVKVAFSVGGLNLFRGVPTELSLNKRGKLVEGLETWLYDIIKASPGPVNLFSYADLYELSGLAGSKTLLKEFSRDVRKALIKMTQPGTKVIFGWAPERGDGVRVFRRQLSETEWQGGRKIA
jgi:hypothetical protein